MKTFLTICFSILSGYAWSQQDTMMVGGSTGWNLNAQTDEYLSPMTYRGSGYGFQVSLNKRNERFYDQLDLSYQQSRIRPDMDNQSAADLYRGGIEWIRTYRLKIDSGRWGLYLGFHFLTGYAATSHTQWPNNGYAHCLALNLGPSFVFDYQPWPIHVRLGWELSVPILNYIIRPGLGSIIPEGAVKRSRQDTWGFISGGSITSLHAYQRIHSTFFVSYRISTRLATRAEYRWDFQHYRVNNPYRFVCHGVYLTLYYRFKK
jgi:hypothetical protein